MEKLVIELMRVSTNLLEQSSQSQESHQAVTQSLKEAIDVLHNTNFEKNDAP